MQHFNDILVVYDCKTDNRALFERAVWLGQRNARVNVVTVIEEPPRKEGGQRPQPVANSQEPGIDIIEEFSHHTPQPAPLGSSADAQQHIAGTAKELSLDIQEHITQTEKPNLEQFVTAIRQSGVQVRAKTLCGTQFLEIIREVIRNRHDLVVITAEGGGSLKQMLLASTAMHLMRKCPCPVWVIKPGQPKQYGRILAAVDATATDAERDELNTSILDMAASLARMQQSELLIVHTWTMCGESLLRRRRGVLLKEEVDEIVRQTWDAHRQALRELLRRHPVEDLNHQVYLLKGEAGALIPELAKDREVELIVMGTLSRSGVAGMLIGHTAEKVLHRVDCSVLTVKPEGFLTPVT